MTLFVMVIYLVATMARYYGENVLHMATVNEDPAMVKYLLDAGVNFQVENLKKELGMEMEMLMQI